MLGNALMQPKRKRGRPRKLSGSSNGTPGGLDDFDMKDSLVQGSPELLEVKMGMDGFAEHNSDSSTEKNDKENDDEVNVKSEVNVKDESEPVAGTSKENSTNSVQIPKTVENDFNASGEY